MQVCYCFMSYKHAIKRKNLGQCKWGFQNLVTCLCKLKDPLPAVWAVYTILIFLYVARFIPKNFVGRFWSQRIWKHRIGATTSEVERESVLTRRGMNYPAACGEKWGAGAPRAQWHLLLQTYGFFKMYVEGRAKPHAWFLTQRILPWGQVYANGWNLGCR